MTTQETPSAGLPVLQVPINFVPAKAGEALKFGQMTIRKMEDDFHTDKTFSKNSTNISTYQLSQDNRIGAAEFIIPTNTNGPPPHWHEMHEETFLATKGTVRFHTTGHKDAKDTDARTGDYVTVPVRAPPARTFKPI